MTLPLEKKSYTYSDYLTWSDDERYELIEGEVFSMSPAPTMTHQSILGALFNVLFNYLKGHACKVFVAPLDVRLPDKGKHDEDIITVVQPDIVIICDKAKVDERGILGAPDLAVEITSIHTSSRDYVRKLALYEKHGIREYWIIDQINRILMVFKSGKSRKYGKPATYGPDDSVKVGLFPDLTISLPDIFAG